MASHHPPFGGGYGDERGDPGAFVVEDLTQGLHEWRNIQDIVRLSFVALHKALQAQGDAIQALTEQTELRALKSDVRLWSRAAQVLSGIDLYSGIRVLSDEYKLQKCVQIAALYLEDDDALNAETYIKKASFLLGACKVRLPSSGPASLPKNVSFREHR